MSEAEIYADTAAFLGWRVISIVPDWREVGGRSRFRYHVFADHDLAMDANEWRDLARERLAKSHGWWLRTHVDPAVASGES